MSEYTFWDEMWNTSSSEDSIQSGQVSGPDKEKTATKGTYHK